MYIYVYVYMYMYMYMFISILIIYIYIYAGEDLHFGVPDLTDNCSFETWKENTRNIFTLRKETHKTLRCRAASESTDTTTKLNQETKNQPSWGPTPSQIDAWLKWPMFSVGHTHGVLRGDLRPIAMPWVFHHPFSQQIIHYCVCLQCLKLSLILMV